MKVHETMHFEYNNTTANYQLNDENLVVDKEQRILGIIIQNDEGARNNALK